MHAMYGLGTRVLNYYLFTIQTYIYYIITTNISITTTAVLCSYTIMPFYIIIFFIRN